MSETTIGWTAVQDRQGRWHPGFTFNPWQGCAKVSPGCMHCYAESIDARFWGGMHWGRLAPRGLQTDEYWAEPLKWDARAAKLGVRLRVFCGSVCDWLEDREDLAPVRQRLLALIDATPHIDWLLLTKRPENLQRLTPWRTMAPGNVWLGVSAENQEYLEARLPRIRELGAVVIFVSAEPLLGPMAISAVGPIDWLIIGSERGPGARRPDDAWLADLVNEARPRGVPLYLKQWQRPDARAGFVDDLPAWMGRQWLQQPRGAGWQPQAQVLQRRCSAHACDTAVAAKLFMCPKHWRMVPLDLQAAIWRAYRPSQEKDGKVSKAYWAAAQAAINAVRNRETRAAAQLHLPFGGQ